MIRRLLGHSQVETTARYAHLARDSVYDAAARIANSIVADLLSSEAGFGVVHSPTALDHSANTSHPVARNDVGPTP